MRTRPTPKRSPRRRTKPPSDVPRRRDDGPHLFGGAGRRPYPNASRGRERHRHGPQDDPPRGLARRHRNPPVRALGDLRYLGARRLARRDPDARRRHPLSGASALQGHPAAQRAGHLRRHRRGRRRDERVHRQGVHLLLRAGARHRSAAGHRRRLRHADRLGDRRGGRGRGARCRPRRDRDDRGRPGRLCARPVRPHHARRHPARPSGPGHRRHRQRPGPRPDRPLLPQALRPDASGRRRRGQRGPRRRGAPGARGVRRGGRPVPHRRGPGRPALRHPCDPYGGQGRAAEPQDRAGPCRPRHARHPAHRRPPLGARGAQHRARRRYELPALPGGPGEARARLQRLLLHLQLRRLRALRRLHAAVVRTRCTTFSRSAATSSPRSRRTA